MFNSFGILFGPFGNAPNRQNYPFPVDDFFWIQFSQYIESKIAKPN